MEDLKKYLLPFHKEAKDIKAKNPDGNDYFIYPGKTQVGDKKLFSTIKLKPGHTYGPGEPSADIIKKEFKDKGFVVKPDSNVYTDTTNVQTFKGKQQKVRHIVDGNIMKKHTSTIKGDVVSGSAVTPIKKKDKKELITDRSYYAGHKEHNVPKKNLFQKVKGWFKGGEVKRTYQSPTWIHDSGTTESNRINKELGLKSSVNAGAVADTARFDNNISRIFLGSVIKDYPDVKTRTKYIKTDTGKEISKTDKIIPAKALEDVIIKQVEKGKVKSTKLKKTGWYQGTI